RAAIIGRASAMLSRRWLLALSAGVSMSEATRSDGPLERLPALTKSTNFSSPLWASARASALSKLDEIVGQMYRQQSSRSDKEAEDVLGNTVMVLDDQEDRRSLQESCTCEEFFGGSSPSSTLLCGKLEAGKTVCRSYGSVCPSDMAVCSGTPAASPGARLSSDMSFLDAEVEDVHHLNTNFEVFSRSAPLPSAPEIAKGVAQVLGVPVKQVALQSHPTSSNQASIQATVDTYSTRDESAAQTTLTNLQTMAIGTTNVDVDQVKVASRSSALVCDESIEKIKADVFKLFSSYLELKSTELDLLEQL
ncbi:MAG: hypothetical protein SGPRY_009332, partial [Prymnesium sp.]